MPEPQILISGIILGESPRWHDDRLWFADWGRNEVIAVDLNGRSEVMARVPSFPISFDWLPDGRLLCVSGRDALLMRSGPEGSLATFTDLSRVAAPPWNELVVDGRADVYVNNTGFDFPGGEFAPGSIVLINPDGSVRRVAGDVAFPNGMVVTPDNLTLILAESYSSRLTAFQIAPDGEPRRPSSVGRARRWRSRMESAWMRKVRSGTPMSRTSAVYVSARAARCSRRLRSTVAASPACSGAATTAPCSSLPPSGQTLPAPWAPARPRARS